MTRYPSRKIERFLSLDEIGKLGRVLCSFEAAYPAVVAIIRLLLLTGARKAEVETLQWSFLDGRFIHLPQAKSGPRTIYLGAAARALIDTLPRTHPTWVFPDQRSGANTVVTWPVWCRVRASAGLEDVRIHDLRHTFASHAAMNRVTLPTIAKLLGHALLETTDRYAHLGDDSVRDAIGRVSGHLARATGFGHDGGGL